MKKNMFNISRWIVACAGILTAATAPAADDWVVAWKGNTDEGTTEKINFNVKTAAGILGRNMEKVLGKKVAVVPWEEAQGERIILVTEVKYAPDELAKKLEGTFKDSFVIKYPVEIDGKKVCLLASHDQYAYDYPVYYFLNKYMGFYWLGPQETGEEYTAQPDWKMPARIDVVEAPDFEMRFWSDVPFNFCRPLLAGSRRMDYNHALGLVFDPRIHGQTPEVYPLLDGKRYIPTDKLNKEGGVGVLLGGWQPCLGNPKSVEIATEYVLKNLAAGTRFTAVSLAVNDGGGNHCTCELCRAMDAKDAFKDPINPNLSDRYFRFYNKVIENCLKKNPDARITALGYGVCKNPPVETKINDRVVVFVTGGDPTRFAKAGVGGTYGNWAYFGDSAYPTIRHCPHFVARYLKEFKNAGGIAYYCQINHSWAAAGPKVYVLARLLWKVDQDVDALVDEYLRLSFGPEAARPMRTYFDRWEQIWDREKRPNPFETIQLWNTNHLRKFKCLKWEDIRVMDQAIGKARQAKMNERQKKRFELADTYYQWVRADVTQYLMAKDFQDPQWLAGRQPDEVLAKMSESLALTRRFDEIWDQSIGKDRTGWLLLYNEPTHKAIEAGNRVYDFLQVDSYRMAVEVYLSSGIEKALMAMSEAMQKNKPKDKAVAFWKEQVAKRPDLKLYLQPEIDRLDGVVQPNLVENGNFEEGTPGGSNPGQPPTLKGWWFYDRVGMVKGSKALYEWDTKNSRNGSKTLGCGTGAYPGLRTFVRLEPGRYRFSFWFKSQNREKGINACIYQMIKKVDPAKLTTEEGVREICGEGNLFVEFFKNHLPPPEGKWEKFEALMIVKVAGLYAVQLEPFGANEGSWVWFDDVEIRKIY